jgi:alpha-L-rhamnosidase
VRFCNKFNYHTFRYVRIQGLVQAPDAGQIKAMLLGTGLTPAFSFSCSNDLANRIHQASMNTFLANSIGGYISDCPDRERAAYACYGLYYAPFLMQHFVEGVVFLEKMVRDGVDAQRQDGLSATASPVGIGNGGGLWTFQNGGGYVFVQTPWQIYLYTGDKRALAMSLAASEKYLTRMESYFDEKAGIPSRNDGLHYYDFLGDWLAEGVEGGDRYGQSVEARKIQANCMYIVSLDRLSKRLEVLGDGESAARYRAKAEAHRHLFHANCYKKAAANYGIDHMTYLAEPLLAEVPPKDEVDAVFRSLENHIRVVAKGHPQSGDGGMANLLWYLLARNRPDLVYLMVNQTDRPSWGAMVKNGDAAIWEDWIMSPAENPPHSRSHTGLGSIGEWFINGLAGIQYDPAQPGFQHAILRPFIPPDMDSLAASSDSSHGTITIRWKRAGGAVSLEVAIPPNTTATLHLPTEKPDAVTESGRPLSGARGVKLLGAVEGAVSLALESGAYAFAW